MTFVIFHGSFGAPSENWFPTLAEHLKSLGQEVFVPQMPTEDYEPFKKLGRKAEAKNQNLENWLATFEKLLPKLKGKKLCFVGHSIGSVFILHAVLKFNLPLDSAIFVSSFLNSLDPKLVEFERVNHTFYYDKFDFSKLKRLVPVSYAVYSDNDQYVNIKQPIKFAEKMGSEKILVPGGGHLGSNFPKFPQVEKLCEGRI